MTRVSTSVLTIALGVRGMLEREIRTRASTNVLARVLCVHEMSKIQEKKIHRTQASTGVLTCVLCVHEIGMSKGQEIKTQRTRTSTGVLARVLRVHGVSKGQEKKILTRHGEHRCARSCPARPRDVEETRKKTHRTRASTGVLARVLRVHGISKR